MAQSFPMHCTYCGAIVQPQERFCTACGFSASHEWKSWQAPLPDSPTMSAPRHPEDSTVAYVPLNVPLHPRGPNHRVRLLRGLLISLISGALLALSELLLRDGYDRLAWGIVWFASLGVLIMAILWSCKEGAKALRQRHRRRS